MPRKSKKTKELHVSWNGGQAASSKFLPETIDIPAKKAPKTINGGTISDDDDEDDDVPPQLEEEQQDEHSEKSVVECDPQSETNIKVLSEGKDKDIIQMVGTMTWDEVNFFF